MKSPLRNILILITSLLFLSTESRAQYYSVNFDAKTVAAMITAYNAGAVTEIYYKEQVEEILSKYTDAELAAAGIFSGKYLERKAMTDLGMWQSSRENYYYRRIYSMVATRIMPKIVTVGKLMLSQPQNAIYWGSYLMKICEETRSLCMQFESVVTNSTLSFKDINFLEINPQVAKLFRLAEMGGADWKNIFDQFSQNDGTVFSKDNLKKDIDNLYAAGAAIAANGITGLGNSLLSKDSLHELFSGKTSLAESLSRNFSAMFTSMEANMGQAVKAMLGEDVSRLFAISGYDIEEWVNDYVETTHGKYYVQKYQIVREDNGEVEWERIFDSYSMDKSTFERQMNVILRELNDNEDGTVYVVRQDLRHYYYNAVDEKKLQGVETVTISVTCNDAVSLGSGSTQYKCRKCGKTMDAHTRECAMKTSFEPEDLDLSSIDKELDGIRTEIISVNNEISALEAENAAIRREMAVSSIEQQAALRQRYNDNLDRLSTLKSQLSDLQAKERDYSDARTEASMDDDEPTDDFYRIPAIMQDCKTSYNLVWKDEGRWSGYTFTRRATLPNMNAEVTFTAKLSMKRKPRYFLGIKIIRAIIRIDWTLESEFSSTHVEDMIKFENGESDEAKAARINDRVSEIARMYPECKVTTEYAVAGAGQKDDTKDVIHLLWSSDRLEIAREVDARITKIYSDLVSLEKMMSYKRGIIDILRDAYADLNLDEGRKLSIIQECQSRWITNARLKR